MTGLLRKDLYVADKSSRLLLLLALAFSLAPGMGTLGNTYALLLAFMLPMNAIAYDERCKWDRYAAMLPYRVEQIVWSKYLLGGIYTLLGEAIILVSAAIRSVIQPDSVDWPETLTTAAMMIVGMILMMAVGLPALYRFGSEKGRLVMILILGAGVGISFGVANAVAKVVLDGEGLALPPMPVLFAGAAAAAIAAVALSFRLSVRFYRRRQNGVYD